MENLNHLRPMGVIRLERPAISVTWIKEGDQVVIAEAVSFNEYWKIFVWFGNEGETVAGERFYVRRIDSVNLLVSVFSKTRNPLRQDQIHGFAKALSEYAVKDS